ncbi:MAG: hypothetical protein Q4D06_01405 [Coriobacteriia bacterium]|nr:hypothetical protein [Coriobacteriia bacterium]
MRRRRLTATTALLAGASIVALAGGTVGAAAALSTDLTVTNHLSLDTVDIAIEQTKASAVALESGESYPHSALIRNLGADCYLRVRAEAASGERSTALTTLKGLDSRSWIQAGDYLYYRPVLAEGKQVDFSQQVSNPWPDATPDDRLTLTVTAEAVQARNFRPDYTSASPWGEIAVEECVNSRSQLEGGPSQDEAVGDSSNTDQPAREPESQIEGGAA